MFERSTAKREERNKMERERKKRIEETKTKGKQNSTQLKGERNMRRKTREDCAFFAVVVVEMKPFLSNLH